MTDLFTLPEEHVALREAVRAFVDDKVVPRAAEIDETSEFPWDVYEAMRKAGFHAVHIPQEYGGEGGDALAAVLVVEEVARGCASTSLIPAVNKLGTLPIMLSGSPELKQRYLPTCASGEAIFSYGLSEREAGSDAASMKTRAIRDGDSWILNGQKSWITQAGVSTYYTVMAVTDPEKRSKGISAFVVHADDPGFSVGQKERKLGIHGSPTCEIFFDNCAIPADRMIGEEGTGFATAMSSLDHTRITIGAQAIGIAQAALELSISYTKDRRQFGHAVSDFQGIQFMLADMAMEIEAARQLVYVAAAKSERGDADLTFFSAASKAKASDVAMRVTTDCVQLLGGAGYTRDWPAERYMRDAKITQIYEGTNQIQRVVMAKKLLAD
jgi:alkylation response protein AidB-like acyl-CoA dehydrogenase